MPNIVDSEVSRSELDIAAIHLAVQSGASYTNVAQRLTADLGRVVTRNQIASIEDAIGKGKLIVPSFTHRRSDDWIATYRYGVDAPREDAIPVFDNRTVVETDRAMVIGDIHLPKTDFKFAETVPQWAKYYGARDLFIVGDTFDGGSQNNFRKMIRPVPFSTELELGRKLLRFYAESFDRIFLLLGNHCEWFMYNQDGNLNINDFTNLLGAPELSEQLIVVPYDIVTMLSGGEKWVGVHQKDARKTPMSVGRELTAQLEACLFVTHEHSSVDGWSDYADYDKTYGRYRIVCVGGLHDPAKLDYTRMKTSTRRSPVQGYGALVNGRGVLISPDPRHTDWSLVA